MFLKKLLEPLNRKFGKKNTNPSIQNTQVEGSLETEDQIELSLKERDASLLKIESETFSKLSRSNQNASDMDKVIAKKAKSKKKADTVSKTIGYNQMFENGTCEILKDTESAIFSRSIKFSDVNYQSAKQEDRENFFLAYGKVLNHFPPSISFQINCINRLVDVGSFQKTMYSKSKDDGLDKFRDEYNEILLDKVTNSETKYINEKFLTFAIEAKDYDEAHLELVQIENDLSNFFKNLGSEVVSLTGAERLEVLHQIYHQSSEPFTFDYSMLDNDPGLTTKDLVCPSSFYFSKQMFEMGNQLSSVFYLKELPTDLVDTIVADLTSSGTNLNFCMQMQKVDQSVALNHVTTRLALMNSQITAVVQKNIKRFIPAEFIPPSLKHSKSEAEELLEDLRSRNQSMLRVTFLLMVSGENQAEFEKNMGAVQSSLRKHGVKQGYLDHLQEQAFNSVLPFGVNLINIKRTLTTESASVFMPFNTLDVYHNNGYYYGQNTISKNPIFLNRKNLSTGSGFILAKSGSGKGMTVKQEIANILLNSDDDVIVIDPEGEYRPMVLDLDGEEIDISASSKNCINPFDFTSEVSTDDREYVDPITMKAQFIMSALDTIVGGDNGKMSAQQQSIVDRVVRLTYQEYEEKLQENPNQEMPMFENFYALLKKQPEIETQEIVTALEIYVEGSLNLFNCQTNVDLKKRLVVFNIKNLGAQLQKLGLMITLDHIWNRLVRNQAQGRTTWIVIDEIYLLFRDELSALYLQMLWKRIRKYGGIGTGITQNVKDILYSKTAVSMLDNSEFVVMLNQGASDLVELEQLFDISPTLSSHINNADKGSGLIKVGKNLIPFKNELPKKTKLYEMMTTDPIERKTIDAKRALENVR